MTDRNKWQDRLRGGDEQDFLTGFRRYLRTRSGTRKAVKRKWNKRIRKDLKRQWMEDPEFRAEYDALEGEYATATVLTTVNAPYSNKLDAQTLTACLHDVEMAKQHAGPVSSFLGDVSPASQEAFASAHGIHKAELAAFAKAFSEWSGEDYPLAEEEDIEMTHDPHEHLIEAARELLPFLKTSSDQEDPLKFKDDPRYDVRLTQAERLRAEADQVEAREAAIWNFRSAMKPFEES